MKGTVKWFNNQKGYGFISDESGKDVFVHYSVIEWEGFKTLKDGEQVNYELKEGEKGLHAARVLRPNAKLTDAEKAAHAASLSSQIEVENSEHGQTQKPSIFKTVQEPKQKQEFTEQ